jgi:hypothetical protein
MIPISRIGAVPAFPFQTFLPVVWQVRQSDCWYMQEFYEEFLQGAFTSSYDPDIRRFKWYFSPD